MKICAIFILLTIICPGGCRVYDFDVKTIEKPSEFSNGLKLQADLSKEIEQGLMRIGKDMDAQINPQPHFYYNDIKRDYTDSLKSGVGNEDSHTHLQSQPPHSQVQHYLEENDKKDYHTKYFLSENYDDTEDTDNDTEETTDTDSETDVETNLQPNDDESGESESKSPRYAGAPFEPKIENFVGTNLFDGTRRNCFSSEDVALLTARKDFECLIPKDLPHCFLNDKAVSVLMHYFYGGNQIIQRLGYDISKRFIEKAFYDTLGGYLKFYMLPVTKYSFYAGEVNLKTVTNVVSLYQQCKTFLNTNGNGWKSPAANILNELRSVHLGPLKIPCGPQDGDGASSCARLDLSTVNNEAEDDQMIVSLPKLEAEDCDGYLGNIWLPFKRKRTHNLRSAKSAFIVVKFYEAVTRCYSFQSICQDTYNHKFKSWILENIQVHLSDEQFYPGLGAILKVYENLKRKKKVTPYREANDMDENNIVVDPFEEGIKEKKNVNDFKDLFLKEQQKLEDPNWFNKMFGKRDDKSKSQVDYHDDDDIDSDDDDELVEAQNKDVCPLQKPHGKNATQYEQAKAAMQKVQSKIEEDNKETDNDKQKDKNRLHEEIIDKEDENENEIDTKYSDNDIFVYKQTRKHKSLIVKIIQHWICLIVLIVILILLIMLCCIMACKRMKKQKRKRKTPEIECECEPEIKPEPETEPEPVCFEEIPKKKRRRRLCDCFGPRKSEEDEECLIIPKCSKEELPCPEKEVKKRICDEVLIKPESSSVLAAPTTTQCSTSTTSCTSSSTQICQPPNCVPMWSGRAQKVQTSSPTRMKKKVVPCPCPTKIQRTTAPEVTRSRSKDMVQKPCEKSDAAIIETTSMDYSSSESDAKCITPTAQKTKTKAVTIDEKKHDRGKIQKWPVKQVPPTKTQESTTKIQEPPTTTRITKGRNKDKYADIPEDDDTLPLRGIRGFGLLQRSIIADSDVKKKHKKSNDDSKKTKGKDRRHSTSWETMYDT